MPGYPTKGPAGKPKPNPRMRVFPKGTGNRTQGTVTRGRGRTVTGKPTRKKTGVIINPKNPQITLRNAPLPKHNPPPKPKVVASPNRPYTPSGNAGTGGGGNKTGNGGGGKVVVPKPARSGGKPTGGGNPVPQSGRANNMGIGFNPTNMATTLTNLEYDSEIAAIQREIDRNAGNMDEAMKDIQGWAEQVEAERARGAAESAQSRADALAHAELSDANIANLFGGAGGGEGAAYSNVNEDMLSSIGQSDASFDARMQPILTATFADMSRRARSGFMSDRDELMSSLGDTRKEKSQAYKANLLQLMDMAWKRRQDNLQYQTAQQALKQAQAMSGIEIQKGKQDLQAGAQQITANNLSNKAAQIALRKSQVELKKLQMQLAGNGLDWSDPGTGPAVAKGALSGALAPNGSFLINPKIAWENAQRALELVGATGDQRALNAIWNAFVVSLRLSHAHKKWGQYRLNKKGELIYDPSRKFGKK